MPRHAWLSAPAYVTACAAALAQPCSPYWSLIGGMYTAQGQVISFDDGSGPALYATNIPVSGSCAVAMGRWNGHGWTLLSQGLPPATQVFGLLVLDDGSGPRLYVSGFGCGTIGYWMRQWDGQLWQLVPPSFYPPGGTVFPLVSFDDGSGTAVYGVRCVDPGFCYQRVVVRWTGSGWVPISGPTPSGQSIWMLGAFDLGTSARLYAGGDFLSIGAVAARGIAMWDGASWQPLGAGTGTPRAWCQYNDGTGPALYVGGDFTAPGGLPGIAKWNGQSWSDVGGGVWTAGGFGAQVRGLGVFDDGRGPALYVAGYFSRAGSVSARGIARWDGESWEPLGAGFGGAPTSTAVSFATFNDGRGPSLFIAGDFGYAGGGTTGGLAQWVGCPNCYANCDDSTLSPRLNVLDFLCFLNKFAARDPYANCTVDATIDIADFICFLNKFAAGCP